MIQQGNRTTFLHFARPKWAWSRCEPIMLMVVGSSWGNSVTVLTQATQVGNPSQCLSWQFQNEKRSLLRALIKHDEQMREARYGYVVVVSWAMTQKHSHSTSPSAEGAVSYK